MNGIDDPNIVELATKYGITDIGQVTKLERRKLDNAVKQGALIIAHDVSYPNVKRVYCTWGSLKINQIPGSRSDVVRMLAEV